VRLIFGELRQGALEGVVVEAIARAATLTPPTVRRAAMMAGDLPLVARAALVGGRDALAAYSVELFRPIQPMLADSADSLDEALSLVPDPALDIKMDGARIQVHKAGTDVRVYTRNLREVTEAVPEVVEAVSRLDARDLILDGEVIALASSGTPLPFQQTMRRFGRRLDIARLRAVLPLVPFFFDCLYKDGRPLVDEPWDVRRLALTDALPAAMRMPCLIDAAGPDARAFLAAALDEGHEGVMVKSRGALYAAGSRGRAWIKVKTARTLDLVVLAAEWGHGRRQGWLSNLHLGARDERTGGFVMLGKTFKGLTDEMLAWQTKKFLELESTRDDATVYVRPEVVVEIAFNELQESPRYPGGLALRFARVKSYREDKSVADADTFATVQDIFRRMSGKEPPRHA
jgi:DNA ligase-1